MTGGRQGGAGTPLPRHHVARVLASPRRGSSWPVEVDAGGGRWFAKLAGAGHGVTGIVAEIIVAELAEAVGLAVPARALLEVDGGTATESRDPELLELLGASRGTNLGFAALAGARDFRPADAGLVDPDDAARVVWLDWLVMNPDRTARNPNLLIRRGRLWLIDHGSALVFQHDWAAVTEATPHRAWPVDGHVLAGRAARLAEWDGVLREALDREAVEAAVERVPAVFLERLAGGPASAERRRAAYAAVLWKRLRSERRPDPPRLTASG